MRREPTPSKFKRWSDRGAVGLVLLGVAYALVLAFPDPAFPHQYEGELVSLQTREHIDAATAYAVLEESTYMVLASGLSTSGRQYKVILTSSPSQFTFFANRSRGSFAVSYPAFGTTYIRPSDLNRREVRLHRTEHSRRSLSSVIAHEVMHHVIRGEVGFFRAFLLPQWQREGVAEYVAKESSFDTARGMELMRDRAVDPSSAFAYFRARAMVSFLVNHRGMSLVEILRSDLDEELVEAELVDYLGRHPTGSFEALLGTPPAK